MGTRTPPNRADDVSGADSANHEFIRSTIQKRTLTVVVISQILGGAGLAAGISVGALLAAQMFGSDSLAGIPTALFTLGSALTAFTVGRLTQRHGRRLGLAGGFAVGGIGAFGVVLAATLNNLPLLFVALVIYGAGTATNLQARYAGADLATERTRATAVSVSLLSTTFGAVAGPNLVTPMGAFAQKLSIPALAGPFLLAGTAYLLAGVVLFIFLRPDPFLMARELQAGAGEVQGTTPGSTPQAPPAPVRVGASAHVGAAVMVLTQIAMVAIMTMTPVHMRAHHHGLDAVGLLIGLHIAAMYLPSLVTGMLIDRIGRIPMAIASGVTLLASGLVAALAPGDDLGLLILALILLGLGWNFGLISGTAMVVEGTVPANRARAQGSIDVLVALAGATGGLMSGVVMNAFSYQGLALAGGVLALLLIPVLGWARSRRA